MVTEVVIENNKRSPLSYIEDLKSFENGKSYKFKPFINVIVGPNGSGKSTLLKLISMYTLCEHTMYSRTPNDPRDLSHLFNNIAVSDEQKGILGGVKVKCDYAGVVFRYKPISEYTHEDTNRTVENMALYMNGKSASIGQQSVQALRALFGRMFDSKQDLNFPMKQTLNLFKNTNDLWSENGNQLKQYYKDNRIDITEEDYQYTVLLDEPDRNLDINNVKELFTVLAIQKEMTQVIAIIHNPVLIYRLSKISHVNFIEMEEGYVKKIVDFVEGNDSRMFNRKYTKD